MFEVAFTNCGLRIYSSMHNALSCSKRNLLTVTHVFSLEYFVINCNNLTVVLLSFKFFLGGDSRFHLHTIDSFLEKGFIPLTVMFNTSTCFFHKAPKKNEHK